MSIDRRYQGPFGSANGGYVAGILSEAISGGTTSVRLRRPVPVGEPVYLLAEDGRAAIRHLDRTLAETIDVPQRVAATGSVTMDEAAAASDDVIDLGMFADCFVCGREGPEGLGVRPKMLADGRFAAIWRPSSSGLVDRPKVPARLLRSALDCPGGFAAIAASGRLAVTGSLTTQVEFVPESDQTLLIVAEATGEEGRKLSATTTIYTDSHLMVATSEAIWVTLETVPIHATA